MVAYDKAQSPSHHTKGKYTNNAFSKCNNKLYVTDLASVRGHLVCFLLSFPTNSKKLPHGKPIVKTKYAGPTQTRGNTTGGLKLVF